MLKRLELIGFKSFADRTVFDFVAGITAVVGPNGSGKSNVVDAVKWVLGEQSAKSLRGGEMADVIFNGSTTRKGLGLAEVTLTFDNVHGLLATESSEVRITRRVYRDGQGEYLINGQLGRLRDIKELFLGTGAGAGAYSIIEQGRVDALLQAAQDDRRAIFEEAAGISRFKARKAECLRRLERVGQNLDRLKDILGEVDGQLRSVRLQASKAQKHQEYADRLRTLRLGLGLREYHQLSEQLAGVDAEVELLVAGLADTATAADQRSADLRRAELEVGKAMEDVRDSERKLADFAARIAALTGALDRDRAFVAQFEQDLDRSRLARLDSARKLHDCELVGVAVAAELAAADAECTTLVHEVISSKAQLRDTTAAGAAARTCIEAAQQEHLDRLRAAARFQNEAVSSKALLDQLHRERDRLTSKRSKVKEQLANVDAELATLLDCERGQQRDCHRYKMQVDELQTLRNGRQARNEVLKQKRSEEKAKAAALAGRIDVLNGMEQSREGLNDGLRHVLDDPNWRGAVAGWVADCLTVDREHAWLIDVALGSRAEAFVIRDAAGLCQLLSTCAELPGRVGFVPLNAVVSRPQIAATAMTRLDELVQATRPEFQQLPAQLLGDTLLVASLAEARRWQPRLPGMRWITPTGELLEADGTLTVGRHHAETGLLSRKSELRELRDAIALSDAIIAQLDRAIATGAEELAALDSQLISVGHELEVHIEQLADLRSRLDRHRERRAGLSDEVNLSRSEVSGLDDEIRRHERQWAEAKFAAEEEEQLVREARNRTVEAELAARDFDRKRTEAQQALTAAEVTLGQARERRKAVVARQQHHAADLTARHLELHGLDERISELCGRLAKGNLAQLNSGAELTAVYAAREATDRDRVIRVEMHESVRLGLQALQAAMQAAHGVHEQQREQLHARQLTAGELRHRRDSLADRLADDYQLDLAAVYVEDQVAGEALANLNGMHAEAAQAEIDDLRKKLQRLGSVNLDALEELAQVEAKAGHLHTQLEDLNHARRALEDIIAKINTDSKRLFVDTFFDIRTHFQDLFRRLFGGGMADIVLVNADDPLESDIDIVARPPGKELRSISLMSGGERTMTAVALLLAIFRSKPSPFCLLDEVDAALDEANTARLAHVLREFAAASQFIVVTHAKRTMAAADVLYGVTMQESGISKRIVVRFDDWPSEERRAA